MLLPSGNSFKCHEEVLYLQPMIPPTTRFEFFPLTGGCSEGLDAFRFFFKQTHTHTRTQLTIVTNIIEREFVATAILSFHVLP